MSQRIYKYVVDPIFLTVDNFSVQMPHRAQILSAQEQGGRICLWALIDTDHFMEERRFMICGTGQPLPEQNMKFIDTVQLVKLGLVFHIFEITQEA